MSKSPALRSRLSEASQHRRGGKRNLGKAPEPIRANKMVAGAPMNILKFKSFRNSNTNQQTSLPCTLTTDYIHPTWATNRANARASTRKSP
jgi:hypothetical protein